MPYVLVVMMVAEFASFKVVLRSKGYELDRTVYNLPEFECLLVVRTKNRLRIISTIIQNRILKGNNNA